MMVKNYRELKVWQKSVDLVIGIYDILNKFPRDEKFEIVSQLRRCSVSVPSNIAEGYGRKTRREFIRFLNISLGSLYELETQLEISVRLNYIDRVQISSINKKTTEIEKMTHGLIKSLRSHTSHHSPPLTTNN